MEKVIKSDFKYFIVSVKKTPANSMTGANAIQSKFFAYFFTPFTTAAKASG
jgi:hypothetical protein